MRVVIAGGGTGGHLFPGIAIAAEMMRRDKTTEITFVGTERGIEASIIPREGYALEYIHAEGFVGKTVVQKIRAALKTVSSMFESRTLLKRLRPDVVVGVGGYASFGPVVTGSLLMSVPTVILEQNIVPGLANRILSRIVDMVCVTYHESTAFLPKSKTHITGNPIRHGILTADREAAYGLFGLERGMFTIFVFGGSAGARKINSVVCSAFSHLMDLRDRIQFLHQTGKHDYESVRETYRKWGFKGTVTPFIHQMAEAYAVSDLVISRAGATTLAELTAAGRPVVLIPYPYAAGSHQEMNALKLSEMGAARVILDHELNAETLAKSIRDLHADPGLRREMQQASRSVGKPDAVQRVVDLVTALLKRGNIRGV